MQSFRRNPRGALRFAAALLALAASTQVHAVGTPANTAITGKAEVRYSVAGVVQTPIESSPTGNSIPGAGIGVNTSFVVDDKVDLTVTEISGGATVVSPGQLAVVTTFRVTNTGNAPHAYQLAGANVAGTLFTNTDNTDVTITGVFADGNNNTTYEVASDTATSILTLAADASTIVHIIANVAGTATNAQYANVRLTASTAVNNTPGTLSSQTTVAETPGAVDIVFADVAGVGDAVRDGKHSADDQYAIQSATLTLTKVSAVFSDPFNGTALPKAIPGANVEYMLTLANTGTRPATGVMIVDPLPANTVFAVNAYSGGTRDVRLTIGGTDTFCIAEVGADTNGDGCSRTAAPGSQLQIAAPALPATMAVAGPSASVIVRFQVTIN